jgi:hypothetical protein
MKTYIQILVATILATVLSSCDNRGSPSSGQRYTTYVPADSGGGAYYNTNNTEVYVERPSYEREYYPSRSWFGDTPWLRASRRDYCDYGYGRDYGYNYGHSYGYQRPVYNYSYDYGHNSRNDYSYSGSSRQPSRQPDHGRVYQTQSHRDRNYTVDSHPKRPQPKPHPPSHQRPSNDCGPGKYHPDRSQDRR